MLVPKAVAIYARISEDRDGEMLGVQRQLKDCLAHAKARGWMVAGNYVDDDVSAYNGKPRPEYRRLLSDIKDGRIDGVVVWHLDRLHRHPRELEEFFEICAAANVRHLASVTGDVDLSTHDGQFLARILGAVSRKESDDKARRNKRKHLELAQAGRWAGGGRPYGYDDERRILPEEAAIIRELARRALAGESLRTLCADLGRRAVPTVRGGRWAMHTIKHILIHPRVAGLRALKGEVIGPAVWKPILSAEDHARLKALLTDPARRLNRTARRYMLMGFLYCNVCGTRLISRPSRGRRAYVCASGPGMTGCGKISILADSLEEFLAESVFHAVDTPAVSRGLRAAGPDKAGSGLASSIADDEAQLQELATMWAKKAITLAEFLSARKVIEDRLRGQRAQFARRDQHSVLRDLVGHGNQLRKDWPSLNLDQRRAIIGAVLDRVNIKPAPATGRNFFQRERVSPVWKF